MGIAAAIAAVTAVVVTPTIAAGGKQPTGKVLRGPVKPVPYGVDGSGLMKKLHGRARLVDGRRRDRITIRVRGLKRRTTYLWHIHEVDATLVDPCAQNITVPLAKGFKHYPEIVTNRRGRGRAAATARRFKAKAGKAYYVNVDRLVDGTSVGCGVLTGLQTEPPPATASPTPVPTPIPTVTP
jgi:hypothetical protein